MIEIVYGTFTIKNDGKVPGTYRVAKTGGKGSVPLTLTGNFTSVGLAKFEIDAYLDRCNGVENAGKARATRRSK